MQNLTPFNVNQHHIYIEFFILTSKNERKSLRGILDTGAPVTEFSDKTLLATGFITAQGSNVSLKPGLQTQKYGKVTIPSIEICGHQIKNFKIFTSRFDAHWGIDALIGLDFFRQFRVTVDYKLGYLITESLQ